MALPEVEFNEIESLFVSGDLIDSERKAAHAMSNYGSDALWSGRFRVEDAKICLYRGLPDSVTKLLRQPLPPSIETEYVVKRYLFLTMAETMLGEESSAALHFAAAEALHPQGALKAETAGVKGFIYLDQERYDQAEDAFLDALDSPCANCTLFFRMQMTMNLGVVALRRQHFNDALHYFTQASSMAQTMGARQALEKTLGNIAVIYYLTGDVRRAGENAEKAAIQAASLGATVDEITWLNSVGLSQAASGDTRAARLTFETVLRVSQQTKNGRTEFNAHVALAHLLLQHEPAQASLHIDRAEQMGLADPPQTRDYTPLLLRSMLKVQQHQYQSAKASLLALIGQVNAAPSLRWNAENTLASFYDEVNQPHEAEQWYRRAIDTFHRQRLTLKSVELQLPFLENGSDLYMGYMEHLIRAGRTGEAMRLLDTSRAETLAEGLGTAPARAGKAADPRALARRLGATILVYCLRPERSYLWAITGKEQQFYTLGGNGTILPLVARHNEAIAGAKDLLAQKDAPGRALYDALLGPAERLLPHGGGRVVLVADGGLSQLNFETLIAPGGGAKGETPHYWIEDAGVTNARSLRLLAARGESRRSATAEPQMLLIGDPVYAKGEYAPLPNAGAEMADIAGHFAVAQRVVEAGRQASPAAYVASRPGRFRFLHFVAHATASELNPLDSAVILSGGGAGDANATNKLYASEILKQPLAAELVTLSSCYSSGTRHYAGEGVVGLAWAFLRAGAHSVIGALWEVSDVSTPKLMNTMYTRLLAGDAPDAALREAKLEMLHSDGVFRKPVYWGAFQLYAGR